MVMKRHFAALAAVAVLGIGWLSLTGRATIPQSVRPVAPAMRPSSRAGRSAAEPAGIRSRPVRACARRQSCRGQCPRTRGPNARAGARSLRRTVQLRPQAVRGHSGEAAGTDQRSAAGDEARRRQRGLDSGLLGLGRRPPRFPVGQRSVGPRCRRGGAGCRATGSIRTPARWVAGMWLRRHAAIGVSAAAAEEPRKWPECRRPVGQPHLDARLLDVCQRRLSLAARLLVARRTTGSGSPPRYIWTPRGAIFVPGYWDYQIVDRGMLFAPVYISPYVYRRPGFFYSPSVAVSLGGFSANLFVGLNFGHYYFGDFYGDNYYRRGFYPWFDFHLHHGYDPLLNYYSWHYRRQGVDYLAQLRTRHDEFILHADLRPPRTYAAQLQLQVRLGGRADVSMMVSPIAKLRWPATVTSTWWSDRCPVPPRD